MNVLIRDVFNRHLDRFVRPEVSICHRGMSAYKVCGFTGLALAVMLVMTLVTNRGLSPMVMSGIVVAGILTFLGLAMVTKIIVGEERLIYYHHEIAILISSAAFLWLIGQPVLPYLDLLILGIGTFLVCGRVGCLMVGCCHGRINNWGVCYREEHARAGFSHYFVRVRLFPIQAVESLTVLCIVLVGSLLVLRGQPPGEALAWYVITYDIGRFCFEFVRGDSSRPYWAGFSEAQWTSLLLMLAVVWAELSGVLVFHLWHAGAAVGLVVAMVILALKRRFQKTTKYQLLHPRHVREVAEAVTLAVKPFNGLGGDANVASGKIHVECTSLGVQISASRIKGPANDNVLYTFSLRYEVMTEETAGIISKLILQLRHPSDSQQLIMGQRGVFHLLVPIG